MYLGSCHDIDIVDSIQPIYVTREKNNRSLDPNGTFFFTHHIQNDRIVVVVVLVYSFDIST